MKKVKNTYVFTEAEYNVIREKLIYTSGLIDGMSAITNIVDNKLSEVKVKHGNSFGDTCAMAAQQMSDIFEVFCGYANGANEANDKEGDA